MFRILIIVLTLLVLGCTHSEELRREENRPGPAEPRSAGPERNPEATVPRREAAADRGRSDRRPEGVRNVVVIVNRNSAVSRAIGAYYARRRGLLSENLCLIATPEREEISRDIYNRQIEMPVGAFLKSRRLVERTLYLVTTLGVPLKIQGSSGSAGTAASVDSELTLLYGKLKGKSVPVTGSALNPFYAQRDAPFGHPRFPIYLVTRLAAYDLASVKGMIDRSLEARNHGRFVLDLKSEDDQPGNSWLRTAAILLPADRVVIDETPAVLYDQRDVIGYGSWGSNDKGRERRRLGFQWLPGAIATEFVSTDGRTFHRPPPAWTFGTWEDHSSWFAGSPQSLTADFIAEGATGASGHVYEPYLMATPRPQYLFPAYYSGRNLAESYYLSMPRLSWMNIVVGDPLCSLGKSR